ncbi:hypothetical protein ACH4M4_35885 [Streptomyces sp. NPDC017254]|uniref:hypothetical protein n=1 Tax=unclassified Streptomyces TaxID=2593676 RepID=UPI0037B03819
MVSLPPPRTTELYYSGAWHAVSVRESTTVSITRGLTGSGTRAAPASAPMVLGNRAREVSVHDPASALYGLGPNTPIRFAVQGGGPHLDFPASGSPVVSTPDHASLGVAGDLDVRVDVAPTSWAVPAALVSRARTTGSQVSYLLCIAQNRVPQLLWSPNGTVASRRWVAATAPVPAYDGQRIVLRATLDINNGAAGCTIRFLYARRLDSPLWLPIGDPVTLSGTTSVFDGTAPLDIGNSDFSLTPDGFSGLPRVRGRVHAVQVYDNAVLRVDVRPEKQALPGASSFTDDAGRVWTLTAGVTLSNKHVRLEGEVPAWSPQRHPSGNDSVMSITPAGIMRRLGIGKRPLDNALHRAITATAPIECWPLTDGTQATAGAPLIGTGSPMRSSKADSKIAWGKGTLAEWLAPVVEIQNGANSDMSATVAASASAATEWAVEWVRAGGGDVEIVRLMDRNPATSRLEWSIVTDRLGNAARVVVEDINTGTTTLLINVTPINIFDGRPHHIRFQVYVTGGNTLWTLYVDGQVIAGDTYAAATTSLSAIRHTALLGASNSEPVSLGYLTYWGTGSPDPDDVYRAGSGFPGETAGARAVRLAGEQGIPLDLDGEAAASERLGVQRPATFLDTLEVASDADLGYLLERRDARSLLYRTRASLYSQAPAVTLDYSQGVISGELRPVPDDRLTRNDIAVTREGGSTARAVETTGPMSVADPPAGVGQYEDAVTLSLQDDAQALPQAWWRVHLGTTQGLRYPRITINLANPRAAALAHDILAADIGDLIRLTKLPDEYGPDDVDLIIRGYTEEVGDKVWQITFICDPGTPWRVGIYNAAAHAKCDTSGSQLTSGITSSATSFSVTTTAGLPWITTPAEMPISITVGGEEMTVTAITGASSPQTFTVIRSVNGVTKSHTATTPVRVARPAVYAL